MVAEEAKAAGLPDEFLTYDEQGLVSGIQYAQAWVVLLPLLRKYRTEIDALSARLEAVEGTS